MVLGLIVHRVRSVGVELYIILHEGRAVHQFTVK